MQKDGPSASAPGIQLYMLCRKCRKRHKRLQQFGSGPAISTAAARGSAPQHGSLRL